MVEVKESCGAVTSPLPFDDESDELYLCGSSIFDAEFLERLPSRLLDPFGPGADCETQIELFCGTNIYQGVRSQRTPAETDLFFVQRAKNMTDCIQQYKDLRKTYRELNEKSKAKKRYTPPGKAKNATATVTNPKDSSRKESAKESKAMKGSLWLVNSDCY